MKRIVGAVVRALIVALVVAAPAFLAPETTAGIQEISLIIGGLIALFVLFEYAAPQPGVIDFRFAPPYNRARFAVFAFVLLLATFYARALNGAPDPFAEDLKTLADRLVALTDFAFSPVAIAGDSLNPEAAPEIKDAMRGMAALTLAAALAGAVAFSAVLWLFTWPPARASFNLWANLPTFKPESGPELVTRLRRAGRLNLLAGILSPLVIVIAAVQARGVLNEEALSRSLPMIWSSAIWANLSALLILRGAAILKIARLVARAQ